MENDNMSKEIKKEENDKNENQSINKKKKIIPSYEKKGKTNHKKEIRSTQTFRDSGYGDDDRYGDVEYMITYSTCPICGKVEEIKKVYLRTICEQDRYGNIYK